MHKPRMIGAMVGVGMLLWASVAGAQRTPPVFNPLAARVDPYVAKPRVIVMTDIANEPDDQMSLVRFLLYSNQLDVEGLIATTSVWMRAHVRPDVIRSVLDAYAQVQPNLRLHHPDFPTADALGALVVSGQPGFGMDAVGPDKMSAGAELIIKAADKPDPRPLWVLGWGGANTLAQALLHVRATRTPDQVDALVSRVRVYTISDQDDAGPWLRREFPSLHYIATPSTPDGQEYYFATWTGISGDRFYRNAPGADFTTFTDEWVNANIRGKGPLGKLYPYPCCIHEGDTPSFLGLIDNGLGSFMNPTYGGWGGRYVWRQPSGEPRPFWTQGGDSYPGRDSSRDAVEGRDGVSYKSDQATIWRWRTAFQHDFAARMDWTIKSVREANHNPDVVVNGQSGRAPLSIDAVVGTPLTLDAAGTRDPDGHRLTYRWFFYPEAGTGIPARPVAQSPRPASAETASAARTSAPATATPAPPTAFSVSMPKIASASPRSAACAYSAAASLGSGSADREQASAGVAASAASTKNHCPAVMNGRFSTQAAPRGSARTPAARGPGSPGIRTPRAGGKGVLGARENLRSANQKRPQVRASFPSSHQPAPASPVGLCGSSPHLPIVICPFQDWSGRGGLGLCPR